MIIKIYLTEMFVYWYSLLVNKYSEKMNITKNTFEIVFLLRNIDKLGIKI